MKAASILWRRLDRPGHELASLSFASASWHLDGMAVFAHEGRPCGLRYAIVCDAQWHTVAARVEGRVGDEPVDIEITVDAARRWWLGGRPSAIVDGCLDLDLNFSPSTNLLPIRRLALSVGRDAPVRAAWLRFPSFALEPLEQVYRRIGDETYRYESTGGRFSVDLQVNAAGFVTSYPGFWGPEGTV